jgi:hypothetical protein
LTLLHLHADVYLKPGYEKDMDMAKLNSQYKVADCRKKNTSKYQKEIEDAFEKLDKRYTDHAIICQKRVWSIRRYGYIIYCIVVNHLLSM